MLDIDIHLVRTLIEERFPHWAGLPIVPVETSGWDNRTFHLGDRMLVRLPSAERYAAQVEKEQRWLPWLGPRLPFPIPVPLARGDPSGGYPWSWSVYRWIDGERASASRIADLRGFALDLARFLCVLQGLETKDGPPAGAQNFHRGGSLSVYDAQTRESIAALAQEIDVATAADTWDAALKASWNEAPMWIHGDVSEGNLLLRNGRLHAVIDFGCCAIGDPACDLVIAWTLLDATSRVAFKSALPVDAAAWRRARGWALWKALITLVKQRATASPDAERTRQVIAEVLADHRSATRQ